MPKPKPDDPAKKSFDVSLPHAPTRRVEAADRYEAWAAYKREVGLISTEHEYEAKEAPSADAPQE